MILAWWNGLTLPDNIVRIDPDDAGFLYGDGLFETLRVDHGQALDVEAHLDRLFAGFPRIGIDIPEDREMLERGIAAVAEQAPRPVSRLRITVTHGAGAEPTRLIRAVPYSPPGEGMYRNGVPVILLPDFRVDSQSPLAGLKSLCYQMNRLALLRAEAAGAFDALLLNERGLLAGGSRSNVILTLPDGVFTPPLADGCLPGTVRRRLLEKGKVVERSLTPEDLENAREVFLTNSLIGVLRALTP
ncbi:MAG TPA: aminotransferase class IV [Thermoanaerobaculia bacterium]